MSGIAHANNILPSGELNVDDIHDPDWNEGIYDNLVLPPGEKELAFAFADQASGAQRTFDDFVQHKGV